MRDYGLDLILCPGMNIHRNPLCGRNFEYYSEDPYISGKMAAAMVKGIQSQGVGTSIKHFVANNAETNRNALDTIVGERALREIYLEGFRIAVEDAQPWTVMSAYNLVNGVYASESRDLLTSVLRTDWGFEGIVMTDWLAGKSAVAQMNAGNDLIMPGGMARSRAIVEAGELDVKQLDLNVSRILEIIQRIPRFRGEKPSNRPDLEAHARVARTAASEGMILLKNESALPFSPETGQIALFGRSSYEMIAGGTGSGHVHKVYTVNLVNGLRNVGYSINEDLETLYLSYAEKAKGLLPTPTPLMVALGEKPIFPELAVNGALAEGLAAISDLAVITIGRNAGEGRDREPVEGDFLLDPVERNLIASVCTAFHAKGKKVVVVINAGGIIEMESWRRLPDAVLLAWQGGQECGNSVADLLSGKVNPSGKLACTIPAEYADVPSSSTFPGNGKITRGSLAHMAGNPAKSIYDDGIYVGYRYYETFKVESSYEFGFGLSYTTFEYSDVNLSSPTFGERMVVSVTVKNTGARAGREVVQLYLAAPTARIDKPVIELKGFAKTRLLQPGESQALMFELGPRSLASFHPTETSWIAETGKYTVKIGASSKDIRRQVTFAVAKDLEVKTESVALAPAVPINEIKPFAGAASRDSSNGK